MRVTTNMITSLHTAECAVRHGDHWTVTWLPGRKLNQDQAMAAMGLAEDIRDNGPIAEYLFTSPFLGRQAKKLGLTLDAAIKAVRGGR